MEPNGLGYNVVAETPTTQGEPVLTVAGRDAFKFLDVVWAGAVIWVRGKDRRRAFFQCIEIAMTFSQLVGQPIVVGVVRTAKGRGVTRYDAGDSSRPAQRARQKDPR